MNKTSSVKKISINLSTGRHVKSAVPAILTVVLFLVVAVYSFHNVYVHNVNLKDLAVYEKLGVRVDGEDSMRGASMRRSGVKALVKKIKAINEIIYKETFSWTELLSALEQSVPRNISIVEITPEFDEGTIEIGGVAKSMDGVFKFVEKLGASKRFSDAVLLKHSENKKRSGSGGDLVFTISVSYEKGSAS